MKFKSYLLWIMELYSRNERDPYYFSVLLTCSKRGKETVFGMVDSNLCRKLYSIRDKGKYLI